jgi:dihydrofolate reductase
MAHPDSRVTIHMAASLDGFIARKDGGVDWLETSDELKSRELPRTRKTVEFHSGDLAQFVNARLRPAFRTIWFAGGGMVSAECLRLGLADEVRYSILPILIGDGVRFFERLDRDVALHLAEVKAYRTGIVELRYSVTRGHA